MLRGSRELVAARARRRGPGFLMCNTYRYHGHHVGDVDRAYYRSATRSRRGGRERDPIERLGAWLRERGSWRRPQLDEIAARM